MKRKFELETYSSAATIFVRGGSIEIIGTRPKESPYVVIDTPIPHPVFIKDKDLERFAVNILKALKSKKLK